MKKLLSILLTAVLVLGLTACGGGGNQSSPSAEPAQSAAPSEPAASETARCRKQTNSLVLYALPALVSELIVNLFTEKYPKSMSKLSAPVLAACQPSTLKRAPYGDVLMGGAIPTASPICWCFLTPTLPSCSKTFLPKVCIPCYINVNSIIVNKTLIDELGATVDG